MLSLRMLCHRCVFDAYSAEKVFEVLNHIRIAVIVIDLLIHKIAFDLCEASFMSSLSFRGVVAVIGTVAVMYVAYIE